MSKPIEEMTKEELAADCVRLRSTLAAEQEGRQADQTNAIAVLTAVRSEHQQRVRCLEEELRQSVGRVRRLETERAAALAEVALLRSATFDLAARLAKAKQATTVTAQQRDSARGWNVGLGIAAFLAAVR
jgi:hypothetical protein